MTKVRILDRCEFCDGEVLMCEARRLTAEQVGNPCPGDLPAVTVIRQEQRDAGTDHFPAPTHVRFKRAADPLIVPATVPAIPMKLEDND